MDLSMISASHPAPAAKRTHCHVQRGQREVCEQHGLPTVHSPSSHAVPPGLGEPAATTGRLSRGGGRLLLGGAARAGDTEVKGGQSLGELQGRGRQRGGEASPLGELDAQSVAQPEDAGEIFVHMQTASRNLLPPEAARSSASPSQQQQLRNPCQETVAAEQQHRGEGGAVGHEEAGRDGGRQQADQVNGTECCKAVGQGTENNCSEMR